MQNISSLKESRVHCGHEDTFSSTRRPGTREEFGSKVGRIISDSNVDGGYIRKLEQGILLCQLWTVVGTGGTS